LATPLLSTKLHVPTVRSDLVARPVLIQRLNEGLDGKLTLVSAPAGYGKTTLLTDWLHHAGRPFAWLTLDANDNDPARFLAYLVEALKGIDPRIGQAVEPMLATPQPPPPKSILTALINDVATADLRSPVRAGPTTTLARPTYPGEPTAEALRRAEKKQVEEEGAWQIGD
jgi:LuxR family maltose regulon positive regulatory protein